jgi:anti-sigma B factor antagonist
MTDPSNGRGPAKLDVREITQPAAFAVEPQPAPSGVLLLRLSGELDLACSDAFRERVERGLAQGARSAVLDMSDVAFMDSSMLREMLRARAEMTGRGGWLFLVDVGASVRRLLELTGTSAMFAHVDTRDEALAQAAKTP